MPEVPDTPLHYPVVLDLRGRLAVVVGPGPAAERKARSLVRYGPDLVVITPDPTPELMEAEVDGVLSLERRPYAHGDLEGASLVVCVDDSPEICRAVAEEAAARGTLAHVKGSPGLSSYSVPSILRRGALQIAISTGGTAPFVAKRVRARLADEFGEEWAEYLALLAEVRLIADQRVAEAAGVIEAGGTEGTTVAGVIAGPAPPATQDVLEAVADSDVLERLGSGEALDPWAVYDEFATVLVAPSSGQAPQGVAPDAIAPTAEPEVDADA